MTKREDHIPEPPITVYQQLAFPRGSGPAPRGVLARFRVYLPDQPGSLAGFASAIALAEGNISFFHYDRSLDSSRVAAEARFPGEAALDGLKASLEERSYLAEPAPAAQQEIFVTAAESVLEIKVRLANRPGMLAAFAELLASHRANVIYMLYNEVLDPESADIAMATASPQEITALLQAINERGYHYRVVYRGSGEQEAANIIGLKLVEKFFLRLKGLLPASDLAGIQSIVESSGEIYQDLVQFATEAGNDLEAGDVYETVLTFASRSRSSIGDKFHTVAMGQLDFPGSVTLTGFRLPTSENIYLFRHGDELTLIDAGHGIYYDDVKKLLRARGMDPARVTRIFITHPDTDHVGMAGYFEEEFGTAIFMHAESASVMENMNRAHGASGGLLNLNKYYTRLSSRFTECRFPAHPQYFASNPGATIGGFVVIDSFSIGPLRFDVLESRGGHTPGLAFFLNREFGLLFTSDYLLNAKSLRPEDKEHLSLYRYLLTSPNRDSRTYREETAALKAMMLTLGGELSVHNVIAYIFPGHGDYYAAGSLEEK